MVEQTLTSDPGEVLQASLDTLFKPIGDLTIEPQLHERAIALENLAGLFVSQQTAYGFDDLHFDGIALRLMLARFHRDAFGLHNFERYLASLVGAEKLASGLVDPLLDHVCDLGIRINTPRPMRTRVAAAFSLWMATLRPVALMGARARRDSQAGKFCAALNFWIATQYLRKFGDVRMGTPADAEKRYQRIFHDFTFRGINLSSLEFLYCAIFTARTPADELIA